MSDTTKEAEFNADVFDSMLHGNFDDENTSIADDEEVVEEADTADEELEDEDNEDQEDTDQEEESEEEEELDEAGDGELDEDSDDEEDDEEEDSLVEDYDSDDEDDEEESAEEDEEETDDESEDLEEDDVEEDSDEESEDEADTEETSDGESPDTDGVDYKAFYDAVVNTEFVVNGKKVKGFADPQKIIQSQQMAGGFSEKMAGFKQYRPFMAPLKDRGMLDDQAKFDLAMNLIDGDKEAIKQHLQSLAIDPLDLDMEKINYEPKKATASQETIVVEDALDRARTAGFEDKFRDVIGKQWDAESFQEFTNNPAVRDDLLNHMETGAYDAVQDKMAEMSRLDYNGVYGNMNTIQRYRSAVQELQKEYNAAPQAQAAPEAEPTPKKVIKKSSVDSEKAKITKARKEAEYKEKAAKQEAKLNQQRKRAASMSKKKPKAKAKPKFDPMELQGDDLTAHLDFLMTGGR